MKKIATLLLCPIILFSAVSAAGCTKKVNVDIVALAEVLCFFDESGIDVEKIEKMTIFRDGSESWYVYKFAVTIHSEDGDYQDVLGTFCDPVYDNGKIVKYDSEKETSFEDEPPDGTTFVVWRMMEKKPIKCEMSEIPEKDIPKLVSKAWAYIKENNIHPEEED